MSFSSKYSIVDRTGSRQEVEIGLTDYKAAADNKMSLSQYLERKYPSKHDGPSTFEQAMASAGLHIRADKRTGIQPSSMASILENHSPDMQVGAITRNDGANRQTPSGRLLFPEVILQTINANLTEDAYDDSWLGAYNRMVAQTQNVTSPRVDQPKIDTTGPEASEAGSIAQLAEPASMVTITLSETSYRVPSEGIGLTVSDEALQATSVDLVGLAVTAQVRGSRIRRVENAIKSMVQGDTDTGDTALSGVTAQSFDSTISAAGEITHKAWVKWMYSNIKKRSINYIMCDLDAAMAIESRGNKPTVQTDEPTSNRIGTGLNVDNLMWNAPMILPLDTTLLGANQVVGIDSRFAIRRIVNVSASYNAVENYVMRRATSFRFDEGEMSHRLYDDAWGLLTLTV